MNICHGDDKIFVWKIGWALLYLFGSYEFIQRNHPVENYNTKQKAPTAATVKKYRNKLYKNNRYHGYFPEFVHPHIVGWYDIKGDGHCGYRSLACGLGNSQEAWKVIRTQLKIYTNPSWGEIEKTITSLITQEQMRARISYYLEYAPMANWFICPDMGILAATALNIILVVFNVDGSCTYPPIKANPDADLTRPLQVVCIGFIHDENHWISAAGHSYRVLQPYWNLPPPEQVGDM